MSTPGFVLDVDERTPPLVLFEGEGIRAERLPVGSRVVYPPASLPGIRDLDAAIRDALLHPHGIEPLPELLRPGMRLTVVFDDVSLPLPSMRRPDVRGRVIEHILEIAARRGVEDVELIAANALHRRMTAAELRHVVGDRVFRHHFPHRLRNHDAEDRDNLLHLGLTGAGEDVEINRRAAESDLLVYVNVNLIALNGGPKSVSVGLASYRSLRHHHNTHTLRHSRSFNDPPNSALHHSFHRMLDVIGGRLKIFTVETTVNGDSFPPSMGFLTGHEWEWSLSDRIGFLGVRHGNRALPPRLRRRLLNSIRAPYGVTGVTAGTPSAVHPITLANVHRQQVTPVRGQSDIGVFGVPYVGPYNVNSIMNPVLAMCMALGYLFNFYLNKPIVRQGGVGIFIHPLTPDFHPVHHPSYIDFYEEVLTETTDPARMEAVFEKRFAEDPWYIHLYRTGHAFHGVHPLYMWYWGAHAMQHLGDVIFVGGDPKVAARMGFRAAPTLSDALETASHTVGTSPSITCLHTPPITMADVR
ncbi:lactate racemase domain-containing protein [Streptomyces sp. DH37]|uniref:lactate racemase domain-containing protein n=1 Tax=Streptomyces sp. DH37 TaxID=3040122 RepID=UPI002440FFCC|nr:lactate racemase domain-containing protein [Streptomyces sp. DH37]MDG9702550.1 lactate racemase domain-containing protein [Streptomyces sp. DH37]